MLDVLSQFVSTIPSPTITGDFDIATRDSVRAFQQSAELPVTGAVNAQTWDTLYDQYATIQRIVFNNPSPPEADAEPQYPGQPIGPGALDGGDF